MSIKTRKFPDIFKKGDKHDKSKYRPISILPVLSKIIEKHVTEHVKSYLYSNKLLYERQSGFRKDHSCETALTAMVDDWIAAIDKNEVVGTVFLDFSKALDLVDHKLLLSKLSHYKFNPNNLRWFSSYLEQRCQQVSVSGKLSNVQHIPSGLPQGSVLWPLLFIMYINDLTIEIEKSVIDFFADDATLTESGISLLSITKNLKADGSRTVNWGFRNKMSIHEQKTKAMFISSAQKYYGPSKCTQITISSSPISNESLRSVSATTLIIPKQTWKYFINHCLTLGPKYGTTFQNL